MFPTPQYKYISIIENTEIDSVAQAVRNHTSAGVIKSFRKDLRRCSLYNFLNLAEFKLFFINPGTSFQINGMRYG